MDDAILLRLKEHYMSTIFEEKSKPDHENGKIGGS
jgi:hypothetical protein